MKDNLQMESMKVRVQRPGQMEIHSMVCGEIIFNMEMVSFIVLKMILQPQKNGEKVKNGRGPK